MSDLFHNSIWLVPASVFIAGLVGSPHCMTMCGPIVMNFANRRSCLVGYQVGRMTAYVAAGAVAGGVGQAVLDAEYTPWLSKFSLLTIALLLLIHGYRVFSGKSRHLPLPHALTKFSGSLWKITKRVYLPKSVSATLAGLLTVFLPCGHLYSFLLGAVATGSGSNGALFMFAFWLGSTPLLSFSGLWMQKLMGSKIKTRQKWAGGLLVMAGLMSVTAFSARLTNHDHNRALHDQRARHIESLNQMHCR